ncbi:MAG: hypothetical protein JXX29_02245, partial [Deltaproteobacteria bacterium]|nr:hypothetical protein [Deltaproteobacteria bacterium]
MEIIPKESQDATEIEVFFEVPEEDGYYNETINIEWEAIPKSERAIAAPSFTRVTFYYRVKNGCIDFIDIDSTKRKCFRKKNVTGFINGKHVQLTDWNGYMDEATDIANESGI